MRTLLRAIAALTLFALPTLASAQIGNPADIANRLNRLENEVQTLSRRVYRGDGAGGQNGSERGQLPPATAANMELRLSQLESEVRRLTGQLEQQGFAIQKVQDQLNRLMTNLDYRLQSLERGSANAGQRNSRQGAPMNQAASAGGNGQGAGQQEGIPGEQPQTPGAQAPGSSAGDSFSPPASPGNQPQFGGRLGTLPRNNRVDQQAQSGGETGASPPIDGAGVAAPGQSAQQGAQQNAAATQQQFETPEALYEEAFASLGRSDYTRAERLFQAFIGEYPDHRLGGNARYWLSETYFARGSERPQGEAKKRLLEQAAVGFAEGYQTQPRGPKAADNLLKLAMTLGALDRSEDACNALSQLSEQFPDLRGLLARQAERQRSKLGCGG